MSNKYATMIWPVALAVLLVGLAGTASAQVNLSSGTYAQDFNSLATNGTPTWTDNVTLPGWYAARAAGGAITAYTADSGASSAHALFSFGSTATLDRALGSLNQDASGAYAYGVRFTNDTGITLSNFTASYTGEQWRRQNTVVQSLLVSYRISSSAITSAEASPVSTWTSVSALNFSSPNFTGTSSSLNGNLATNRTVISSVLISGLVLSPGQELFLRWFDPNESGLDHALAIDDLVVAFSPAQPEVVLDVPIGTQSQGEAGHPILSGYISPVKIGAGRLTFTNANTYSGKTRVLDGTLSIDSVNRLGPAPALPVSDQLTLDGATLEYTGSSVTSVSTRGVTLGVGHGTFLLNGGSGILDFNGAFSGPGALIKRGTNRLDLNNATNSYAGGTYLYEGEIGLDGDSLPGTGSLHLAGGTLGISATRSTVDTSTFLTNPLVVTSNSIIRSTGGSSSSSRIAIFSGTWSGTGGALTLLNGGTTITNNTFDLRHLGGGFDFSRPVVLDGGIGTNNFTRFFLGNPATAGTQTFSGEISGNGLLRRSMQDASPGGVTILTAANTYSGGTEVAAGTLLVNNPTGSGTGAGVVTVSGAGVLGGTGTIGGAVSINAGGTLAPGESIGTLTINNTLTLASGGTNRIELNKTNGTTSDRVLGVTTLTLGGRLELSNLGPALAAGDSFNVFTATTKAGQFATVSPTHPDGNPALAWDTLQLTNGIVAVHASPVAGLMELGAEKNRTNTLAAAKLVARGSDADGDPFSVTAVSATSAQGGTVTLNAGLITYAPPLDYVGADSFTYMLSDHRGGSVTGTVTVAVTAPAPGFNIISVNYSPAPPVAVVTFAGIPNASYAVELSTNLVDWTEIIPSVTAGANGLTVFTNDPAPSPAGYYRTRYVSGP